MFSSGSVHKLSNHQTEFGVTDSVKVFENLLLCSGYDLDNGVGYVNGNFTFMLIRVVVLLMSFWIAEECNLK